MTLKDYNELMELIRLLKAEREVLFRMIENVELSGLKHTIHTEKKLFGELLESVDRIVDPYDED